MNIFDLAGVDLLIAVEGAAADGFDFALESPRSRFCDLSPMKCPSAKRISRCAASRDHVGCATGLRGNDEKPGAIGLSVGAVVRRRNATKCAGKNRHHRYAQASRHDCPHYKSAPR